MRASRHLGRVFYTEHDVRDIEALAPLTGKPRITADASSITVRYEGLESPRGERLDIVVELHARIDAKSDDVRWTITVENHQPGITITEEGDGLQVSLNRNALMTAVFERRSESP